MRVLHLHRSLDTCREAPHAMSAPDSALTALSPLDGRYASKVAALREHQGNVSAVARSLDKDRKQIQRWIKRFGLDPSTYR